MLSENLNISLNSETLVTDFLYANIHPISTQVVVGFLGLPIVTSWIRGSREPYTLNNELLVPGQKIRYYLLL